MKRVKIIVVAILICLVTTANLSSVTNALSAAYKTAEASSYTSKIQTPITTVSQINTTKDSPFVSFMNNIIGTVIAIVSISYATSIYVQSRRHPNCDKNRN